MTDVTCCEKTVTTPFCPYCGMENVDRSAGATLLAHVRDHRRMIEGRMTSWEREPHAEGSLEKSIVRINKTLVKWRSWESWLQEKQ